MLLLILYNSRCLVFCMVGFGGRGDSTIGPLPMFGHKMTL